MSRAEKKKSLIGGALLALVAVLLAVLIFQNFQANIDRDTAQSSAATSQQQKKNLAEEVADACQSGQVIKSVAGVDLCARAATIAQQPVTIEGPQGPAGPRGLPGADGDDGEDGAAGSTGKTGSTGKDGSPGAGGTTGLTGASGADGATGPMGPPGPAGKDGTNGAKGEPGKDGSDGISPASIAFTDATGTTYSCTPDPPGSATYTCITQTATPPGG